METIRVFDSSLFAARLKELRQAAGMTQKELAEKAGVALRTVSSLEQGLYEPVWSTAIALASALGLNCTAFQQLPANPTPAPRGRPRKAAAPAPKQQKGSKHVGR